jgi:hypothetical protein
MAGWSRWSSSGPGSGRGSRPRGTRPLGWSIPMNGKRSRRRKLSSPCTSGWSRHATSESAQAATRRPPPGGASPGNSRPSSARAPGRRRGRARGARPATWRPSTERVEVALLGRQLLVEPALATRQRREHHALGRQALEHAVHDQRRRRHGPGPPHRHARQPRHLGRGQAPEPLGEGARLPRVQRVAVHRAHGRVDGRHVRLGQRPPAPADGVEHRLGQGRGQPLPQQRVDVPPCPLAVPWRAGLGPAGAPSGRLTERSPTRSSSTSTTSRLPPPMSPASPGGPVEARDDAHARVGRLLPAAQDPHLESGLALDGGRSGARRSRPGGPPRSPARRRAPPPSRPPPRGTGAPPRPCGAPPRPGARLSRPAPRRAGIATSR